MKIRLTFKDPDHAVQNAENGEDIRPVLTRDCKAVEKFVEYDEYVTIEIDTDKRTARVVPVNE